MTNAIGNDVVGNVEDRSDGHESSGYAIAPNPSWHLPLMALVVVGGVWVGEQATTSEMRRGVFGLAALVGLGVVARGRLRAIAAAAMLILLLASVAAGRSAAEWRAVSRFDSGPFEGVVQLVSDPQPIGSGRKFVTNIDGDRFQSVVYGGNATFASALSAGDWVFVRGVRRDVDERGRRRMQTRHVVGVLDVAAIGFPEGGVNARTRVLERTANDMRSLLSRGASVMRSEDSALFRGLVYGDDADQSVDTVNAFRASGLAHLTAVSGQNVGYLLTVLGPFLRRRERWARVIITLSALGWFAVLTRLEPSVVRAAGMAVGRAGGGTRDVGGFPRRDAGRTRARAGRTVDVLSVASRALGGSRGRGGVAMAPARHGERHWDRPDSADAVDGGAYLSPPMCQSWLMGTYLLHGSDEVLLSTAVSDKIRELVGEGDRSLMLEEFVEDYVMGAVIESANTPPFFTERRVVVVHQLETTTADDIDALSNYIRDEADFTDLVVVWHKGKILKALTDAVKAAGGRSIDVRPQNLKAKDWLEDQVAITGLNLNADAMELLVEWLGEDVGRFEGLARTLASTYGATVMVARRMMIAGERHPLQIMAQLHTHFARLAKLDGPSPQSVNDVMALLNVKSYPAEKALKAYRNLGSAGVRRAFELLAAADRDLRGGTGLEKDVVMDVLVARLAKLTSPRGGRR
ncbi:MAG: hypothetical protein EB010_05675 [Acidimicrobiia bacterium]|nr:hypothetical protein [Acidimicrobiia bacterium]